MHIPFPNLAERVSSVILLAAVIVSNIISVMYFSDPGFLFHLLLLPSTIGHLIIYSVLACIFINMLFIFLTHF